MKRPVPKHEARFFIGAMTVGAPTYSIEEAVEAAKQIEAEAIAHPKKIDVDAIYKKFNKRN